MACVGRAVRAVHTLRTGHLLLKFLKERLEDGLSLVRDQLRKDMEAKPDTTAMEVGVQVSGFQGVESLIRVYKGSHGGGEETRWRREREAKAGRYGRWGSVMGC